MIRRALGWWGAVLVLVEAIAFGFLIDLLAGFMFAGITMFGVIAMGVAHDKERDDDT